MPIFVSLSAFYLITLSCSSVDASEDIWNADWSSQGSNLQPSDLLSYSHPNNIKNAHVLNFLFLFS